MRTLVTKAIDDTLLTAAKYKEARLEYDSYKSELEAREQRSNPSSSATGSSSAPGQLKLSQLRTACQQKQERLQRLKQDVAVKMQFLEENRVQTLRKHLLQLHAAMAHFFTGNDAALRDLIAKFRREQQAEQNSRDGGSFLEH